MSKTSSKAKNAWNARNYDSLHVQVPKGTKDRLKRACEKAGISMNSIFKEAAQKFLDDNPE